MEPLPPSHHRALFEAHPQLTEDALGAADALLSERFLVEPQADPARLEALDRQRVELIERTMPRAVEVLRARAAQDRLDNP